jgi:hypothetical protein
VALHGSIILGKAEPSLLVLKSECICKGRLCPVDRAAATAL